METAKDSGELWQGWIDRKDGADGFRLTPKQAARMLGIYTEKKTTEITLKRFLFWYYVKQRKPKLSNRVIGEMTGGQVSTTVLHGIRYAQDPYKWKAYLKPYENEVFRVICKTDLSNVREKGQSLQKRKDKKKVAS